MVQMLLYLIPRLALVASLVVKILTSFLPDVVLRFLVNVAMRSPPTEALETTLGFLKSRNGVRQAMYAFFFFF